MSTEMNGINVNLILFQLLAEKATEEGAEIRTDANVATLVYDGSKVVGVKVLVGETETGLVKVSWTEK